MLRINADFLVVLSLACISVARLLLPPSGWGNVTTPSIQGGFNLTRDNGTFSVSTTLLVTGCDEEQTNQLKTAASDAINLASFGLSEIDVPGRIIWYVDFSTAAALMYWGPGNDGNAQGKIQGRLAFFLDLPMALLTHTDTLLNAAGSSPTQPGDWWYNRYTQLSCKD